MSSRTRYFLTTIFLLTGVVLLQGQTKRLISGNVRDAASKEPLPFVTISLKKALIGIVTNEEGKFDLYIPGDLLEDTLVVNYLGYKSDQTAISNINSPLTVTLDQAVVELQEIEIRSLAPEVYIRMAMRKVRENYSDSAFETEAYYREKVLENLCLVKCDEGIMKTYCEKFTDTLRVVNQLLLFRRAEHPEKVSFMSRLYEHKDQKPAKPDTLSSIKVINLFGGPAELLKNNDLRDMKQTCLDTAKFKSYVYSFARSSTYNTAELLVIDYKTKGKVDHVRESGRIYIDKASFAIVKLETKGDLILPFLIKPVFFLLSLGIKNPKYKLTTEFQQARGKWYPKSVQVNMDIIVTNNHAFRTDEYSEFKIEQFYAVNKLKIDKPLNVPGEKRFDPAKDISKQVYNDEGISWEGLNIIKE